MARYCASSPPPPPSAPSATQSAPGFELASVPLGKFWGTSDLFNFNLPATGPPHIRHPALQEEPAGALDPLSAPAPAPMPAPMPASMPTPTPTPSPTPTMRTSSAAAPAHGLPPASSASSSFASFLRPSAGDPCGPAPPGWGGFPGEHEPSSKHLAPTDYHSQSLDPLSPSHLLPGMLSELDIAYFWEALAFPPASTALPSAGASGRRISLPVTPAVSSKPTGNTAVAHPRPHIHRQSEPSAHHPHSPPGPKPTNKGSAPAVPATANANANASASANANANANANATKPSAPHASQGARNTAISRPSGSIPNRLKQDPNEEITTIFVSGFPDDITEREFANYFIFSRGFEASSLTFPCPAPSPSVPDLSTIKAIQAETRLAQHQGSASAPNQTPNQTPNQAQAQQAPPSASQHQHQLRHSRTDQIIGFAKFRTRAEAWAAREQLNGRVVDQEHECVLKTEMAKKNLHLKSCTSLNAGNVLLSPSGAASTLDLATGPTVGPAGLGLGPAMLLPDISSPEAPEALRSSSAGLVASGLSAPSLTRRGSLQGSALQAHPAHAPTRASMPGLPSPLTPTVPGRSSGLAHPLGVSPGSFLGPRNSLGEAGALAGYSTSNVGPFYPSPLSPPLLSSASGSGGQATKSNPYSSPSSSSGSSIPSALALGSLPPLTPGLVNTPPHQTPPSLGTYVSREQAGAGTNGPGSPPLQGLSHPGGRYQWTTQPPLTGAYM